MMRSFTCLVIFFCFIVQARSQNIYTGYYINLKGDTITGTFPRYKEWALNPETVNFIQNNNKTLILTPQNARGFYITGFDRYVAAKVIRTVNPTTFSAGFNVTEANDISEQVEVFLHVVYDKNNIRLLELHDQKRINYFIKHKIDTLVELKYKTYTANSELVEDRTYRNQLNALFYNKIEPSKKLQSALGNLPYDDEAIAKFLDNVQNEKAEKIKPKYPSDFALVLGASVNSFVVSSSEDIIEASVDYKTSIAPVIGISYNSYSKRNFGKNMLSILLSFYSFNNQGTYTGTYASQLREYTFKSNIASFGFAIGRNWVNTPAVAWYTSVIPTFDFFIGNKALVKTQGVTTPFGSGRNIYPNIGLKAGVAFRKKFGIWLMYNLLVIDTQSFAESSTNHRALQFGIDYRFH